MKIRLMRPLAVAAIAVMASAASSTLFAEEGAAEKKGRPKKDPAEMFAKLDANSDGEVTKKEFQKARPKMPAEKVDKMFKHKDKDKNGSLSLKEFSAKKDMKDRKHKELKEKRKEAKSQE